MKVSLNDMIGSTVTELYVGNSEGTLLFKTADDKWFCWNVVGDCCSDSWFADIVGFDALIKKEILSVEEVPCVSMEDDGRSRQDSDLAYSYKLTTKAGYVDIIFRNSSNGYYGGWMEVSKEDEFLEKTLMFYTRILDDWQA